MWISQSHSSGSNPYNLQLRLETGAHGPPIGLHSYPISQWSLIIFSIRMNLTTSSQTKKWTLTYADRNLKTKPFPARLPWNERLSEAVMFLQRNR